MILVINVGSSTIKFALYKAGVDDVYIRGSVRNIGHVKSSFSVNDEAGNLITTDDLSEQSHKTALHYLTGWLTKNIPNPLSGIGHRLVHGGPYYFDPQVITPQLLDELKRYVALAPVHLPNALLAVETMRQLYPNIPQVACFDTSFHQNMPEPAKVIPLPQSITASDIRRYGFHGLSYEYIYNQLQKRYPDILDKKIVIAHLGSGAGMVAIKEGKSIDTTMGFSPSGGLVMGTRLGDTDPGVILYLLKGKGFSVEQVADIVNHQSGLKAVSGNSSDMRVLLKNSLSDVDAKNAVDLFCYHAKKHLGALIAVLGGLDILVFTGGIGEAAPAIRYAISNDMAFVGIAINEALNNANEETISTTTSKVAMHVIPTNEEIVIARHTQSVINKN